MPCAGTFCPSNLLTPNRPEAELLADMKIDSENDIDVAARKLIDMGPKAVLIKGGFRLGLRRRIHVGWLCRRERSRR